MNVDMIEVCSVTDVRKGLGVIPDKISTYSDYL